MARKTAELLGPASEDAEFIEKPSATTIWPVDLDPDSEATWDEWIESLKGSEHPGIVRAYRVPMDAEGNPLVAKGSRQVHLGTWPHQAYSYDDLLAKIKMEFLKPGESAVIRLSGMQPGRRGVLFNKMVTVQRAASDTVNGAQATGLPDSIGLLRAFQEASAAQQAMTERLLASRELAPAKPVSDTVREWLAILAPLLGPTLLALVNRPKPQSDLEGLIGAFVKLKGLTGDGGGDGDESSTASIIKAVAPEGLKLLTAMAQNQSHPQMRAVPPRRGPRPVDATVRSIPPQPVQTPPQAAPQPTPAPAPQSSPVSPPAKEDAMLAQLKPQLDTLAQLAQQGADPAEVAKLVLSTLPTTDEVDEQIYNLVADPAAFTRLLILSPALAQQAEWAERLRLAILVEFSEEETATPVT